MKKLIHKLMHKLGYAPYRQLEAVVQLMDVRCQQLEWRIKLLRAQGAVEAPWMIE